MFGWLKNPFAAQPRDDGSYDPSPFTLMVGTSSTSDYVPQDFEPKYTGNKSILVVCTDESLMEMENKKSFNTGNHPIEMLVPMLHFQKAGFTSFHIVTATGGSVKLEMWAFPTKDEAVTKFYEEMKPLLDKPQKISDIPKSLDDYVGIFIPGGHGCMINLPFNTDLGNLLHTAHEKGLPTVTLCHGPSALLSTGTDGTNKEFAYKGYESMCFTDKTDGLTPTLGYLPGRMPWKCQERLEQEGMKILNTSESGAVTQHKELITGDGPKAAHNLGKLAAPILVQYAIDNKL